jgi:hypothetical protein
MAMSPLVGPFAGERPETIAAPTATPPNAPRRMKPRRLAFVGHFYLLQSISDSEVVAVFIGRIFNGAQNALRDFLKTYNGGLLWTRNRLRRQFLEPDFTNSMR